MRLATDEIIGDGRYLLLAPFGGDDRAGMEFWHAHDGVRRRDVALTVLVGDRANQSGVAAARHVLEGVRYGEAVAHPALAQVIDVPAPGRLATTREGVLGLVVADWTDGVDMADGVLGARLPMGLACRLLRPLVEAVDQAHRAGVVAGVDSPGRIRIAPDSTAVLAFRGTAPATTTRDDVRGLGALLYLALTGSWPAADSRGRLVDPVVLRPDVRRDLAAVAVACLGGAGPELRTCGPLLRALDDAIADEPPPVRTDPAPERPARRANWLRGVLRGRRVAVAVGTLAVVLAVLIGTQVAGPFRVTRSTADQRAAPAVATTTPVAPTSTTTASTTTTTPPPAPIVPKTLREYVVSGSADNPATLSRVLDGDPGTVWRTDTYRQQFPVYSPGIGVVAGFGKPTTLRSVTITSPSPGTVVQLRSATGPDVSLADTTVLKTTTLAQGATTITLPHRSTRYLLVWITKLGETDGGFRSQIGEITYLPAS
jgi:hypothetical protein